MIDKETQRIAWACLPRELKEEVKKRYNDVLFTDYDSGYKDALTDFFGLHNLTSDAEGEEMLTVSRKKVQESYAKCKEATKNPYSYPDYSHESALSRMALLDILFGSKCLPDEKVSKSTPLSEPKTFKYSVGQKVILHFYGGEVSTITEAFNDGGVWNKYKVKMLPTRVWNENELDPYEEPKPAEPKYHIGQYVRHKPTRLVDVIDGISQTAPYIYHFRHMVNPINSQGIFESDLEPYTEPIVADTVIESTVQMIEQLTANGYKLNEQ